MRCTERPAAPNQEDNSTFATGHNMRLLDTHLHLILPKQFGYDWTAGIDLLDGVERSAMQYRDEDSERDVRGAIFMETAVNDDDYQNEARYIATEIRRADSIIIGMIASCRPEAEDGFEAWMEEGDQLGVAGYRRVLHTMPDDLSETPIFRDNIKRIGEYGKPFDLCVLERQLPVALSLASACEDTVFVLDHCGVPDIAAGDRSSWERSIAEIGRLPNVNCKVSGLLAYCGAQADAFATLRPYLNHVLETFSPERLVWGSDWPVVHLGGGLSCWLDATRRFLSELSEEEASAISWRNAERIYQVDLVS